MFLDYLILMVFNYFQKIIKISISFIQIKTINMIILILKKIKEL
jgi:hypothetical protein